MRKRFYQLIVVIILTMLTACGAGQMEKESVGQAGDVMPGNEAESEAADSETAADGENMASAAHEYEKESVVYKEPEGGLSFRKDMDKTQTEYAAYYFESSIGEQERERCIAATDKVLSGIEGALPELEIVVIEPQSTYGICVSDGRLYLSPQDWDSADYLAKVLLAGYGEWGNYGLAYGYADYLCKKVGLDSGDTSEDGGEEDCFLPMSAPEAYDLNLLCYDEKFVSSGDVEAAKNNACLFVKEYLSSHSEEEYLELLSQSGTLEGMAPANKALEEFYERNGVECSLTGIRYRYGGLSLDYAAACEYACFHIEEDWQDELWKQNPMVPENFLHEEYGEVRKFFECNECQMGQYQELFGFDSYNNSLLVMIQDLSYVPSSVSFYGAYEHTIYLNSVISLMHEYIHSLMEGRFIDQQNLWKIEGLARYFSYKYDLYSYDWLNESWNDAAGSYKCIQEYIDTAERGINVQMDFRILEDIQTHAVGITDPNVSYLSGSSFIGYLVDQYGQQAVIDYVCSDNEYNAEWDKSYDELVQDWNRYIEKNYSQYSKN